MFIPLHDEAPPKQGGTPWITWGIIIMTSMIYFVFQSGMVFAVNEHLVVGFGLIPSIFFGWDSLDPAITHFPKELTPLSYIFLHGSWMHLIGNMLFLLIFSDNVEDAFGKTWFFVFYLGAGALAGVGYAFAVPLSQSPLIGASGAVAAVLGAYAILHPRAMILGLLFKFIPLRIPALLFIVGWFVFQVGHAVYDANREVAWVAHVCGVLIGAVSTLLWRRKFPGPSDMDIIPKTDA